MRQLISFLLFFLLIPLAISAQAIPPDLFKKANAGDAEAQNEVGFMYGTGTGIPQDHKKAVEWYYKYRYCS
jgi:TPR repeat protein